MKTLKNAYGEKEKISIGQNRKKSIHLEKKEERTNQSRTKWDKSNSEGHKREIINQSRTKTRKINQKQIGTNQSKINWDKAINEE